MKEILNISAIEILRFVNTAILSKLIYKFRVAVESQQDSPT